MQAPPQELEPGLIYAWENDQANAWNVPQWTGGDQKRLVIQVTRTQNGVTTEDTGYVLDLNDHQLEVYGATLVLSEYGPKAFLLQDPECSLAIEAMQLIVGPWGQGDCIWRDQPAPPDQ